MTCMEMVRELSNFKIGHLIQYRNSQSRFLLIKRSGMTYNLRPQEEKPFRYCASFRAAWKFKILSLLLIGKQKWTAKKIN